MATSRRITVGSRVARWRPRTLKGWIRAILLVLALVVGVSYLLARRTPGWYRPPDPAQQAVLDDAGRFELQGTAAIHNAVRRTVRGEQTFGISQKELNAFLAIRYGDGSAAGGARRISGPMVIFAPGRVTLAARAHRLPVLGSGVLSVTGSVEVLGPENAAADPSTRCRITLRGVQIGSLPVPQALVRERMNQALLSLGSGIEQTLAAASDGPPRAERASDINAALQAISRGEPFAVPHRMDRHNVFLKSIVVEEGRMTVTLSPTPVR